MPDDTPEWAREMEERIVKRVNELLIVHEEKVTRAVMDRIDTSAADTRENSRHLADSVLAQGATIKRIVQVFAEDQDGHTSVSARTAEKFRDLFNGAGAGSE